MIALGIETSGRIGSVALCDEERPLASYTFPEGARHARDIVPAVDDVVARAGLTREQIAAVAVSRGPGSFTGLRVGVTCAKLLAWTLGWKCVGVPSLEVLAQNVNPGEYAECTHTCPVLDARRGKVHGALFQWEGGWRDATGVLCLAPEELAERLPEGTLVFGSGVAAAPQVFTDGHFRIGEETLRVARAETVARLGIRRIAAGRDVDPMQLVPHYHRATGPEEKLEAGRLRGY